MASILCGKLLSRCFIDELLSVGAILGNFYEEKEEA
jgi:hypothetical protein